MKATYAAFFNPISISGLQENQSGFFNSIDLGLGVGYRTSGGFLWMVTVEFLTVKQPKEWFVNQFSNNQTAYYLEGEAQKSIDYNDTNIFYNRLVTTIGFKVGYTFDIIKNYYKAAEFKAGE